MLSSLHRCGKRLGEISGVFFLRKMEDMTMLKMIQNGAQR